MCLMFLMVAAHIAPSTCTFYVRSRFCTFASILANSTNRARTCDIMINSHALCQLSYGGLKYVVADVPTTSHAIDLVLIQDNPKPLNLRSVDEHKLISWIFKSNRYCAIATIPTGLEPAISAVTGQRDNQLRYRTKFHHASV